jgi:putative SOS response-associated peptidase YedK
MCIRWDKWTRQVIRWSEAIEAWIPITDWAEGKDTYPGYESPIIFQPPPPRHVIPLKMARATWGFPLGDSGKSVLHARSETIAELPMFKGAFRSHRCLLPMEAFYEQLGGHWFKFAPADGEAMTVAGIFRPPKGDRPASYVMVTSEPNEVVAPYQDRMPVVIDETNWDAWLSADTQLGELRALMLPMPAELLLVSDDGPVRRRPKKEEPTRPVREVDQPAFDLD